jgi:hypothetical protein
MVVVKKAKPAVTVESKRRCVLRNPWNDAQETASDTRNFPSTCQHVTSALDNCIGTRFWCSVCLSPRGQIIPLRRGWARPEEPACHIHISLSGQLIQIGDPDSRRRQGTRQGGRRRDPLALLLIRFLFSLFCGAAIARSGPGGPSCDDANHVSWNQGWQSTEGGEASC